MKSIASSVDHERQNEKKQLNYQNQVGSLGHEKHLKQISEYTKNQMNSSRVSVDQKLIIFKKLINEGPFYMCSLSEMSIKNLYFAMMKINLSHKYKILIW